MQVLLFAIVLVLGISTVVGQLPFQVKPRPRGFPGKRFKDEEGGRRRLPLGRDSIGGAMYRLNDTFIPSHYQLELRVILDKDEAFGLELTAPGKVKIVGVSRENTSRIVLHANELKINASSIQISGTNSSQKYLVTNVTNEPLLNFFIISLDNQLEPGKEYEIYMEYVALITDSEEGLFYRLYETDTGEKQRIAVTQLESVEARKLLPCFDEPALKATFELTVIKRNNYTALSNTELVNSTKDPLADGWTVDRFARTVKMSTYNLALAVTDYGYVESTFGTRPARIYGPKAVVEAGGGDYAAQIVPKCISFYESFLNESYKLSKMDSIAVPEFGGAMENWGLNVYSNENLIHFSEEDSEAHRTLITNVMAHELAHQWFGNLVTMKWWNDLYLVEGLSSYMQYLGMEAASNDLLGLEFAVLDAFQYSLLADARPQSHPLSWNVTTPEEIDEIFDTISYEKGASIFRMIEGFLTKETFQLGLQIYLNRHAFGAVEQEDLFQSLAEAASQHERLPPSLSVSKILHSWTDQTGFPYVRVKVVDKNTIAVSQDRFRNKGADSEVQGKGRWYIPITTVTQGRPNRENSIPDFWLEDDGWEKDIVHNTSQWIMVNHNATGFYRVFYDEQLLQLIRLQLESNADIISPLSRSQLLDDYFVFAKQGYVKVQTLLELTRFLEQEKHFTVWGTFFDHFKSVYRIFSSHVAFPLLKRYLQPKVDKALIEIGLEESKWHTGALAVLRADLLDWSCSLRSPLCKEYAGKLFAQWKANPSVNPITSVDTKATLECAMVATGGRRAHEFFLERYKAAENDTDSRQEILTSMSCAMDPVIIQEFLGTTVNLNPTTEMSYTDGIHVCEQVALNPMASSILLDFMERHIDYIVENMGQGVVGSVLSEVSRYFSTKQHLERMKSFITTNKEKLPKIKGTIKSVLGRINDNIQWMDSTGSEIWQWLWLQHKRNKGSRQS